MRGCSAGRFGESLDRMANPRRGRELVKKLAFRARIWKEREIGSYGHHFEPDLLWSMTVPFPSPHELSPLAGVCHPMSSISIPVRSRQTPGTKRTSSSIEPSSEYDSSLNLRHVELLQACCALERKNTRLSRLLWPYIKKRSV